MVEYWVKEIKGQLNEIDEISWVDCDIHNPSGIFTIFENNIHFPILRFGYRTKSNTLRYF